MPRNCEFITFFRNNGLSQLVNGITRPSKYRGSCIDWVVTNSPFVLHSGVSNVLISDHLTVFCIRKKKRENIRTVYRVFRDFKNYSKPNFVLLLKNYDWNPLRNSLDPNSQWEMLYKKKESWKYCL